MGKAQQAPGCGQKQVRQRSVSSTSQQENPEGRSEPVMDASCSRCFGKGYRSILSAGRSRFTLDFAAELRRIITLFFGTSFPYRINGVT